MSIERRGRGDDVIAHQLKRRKLDSTCLDTEAHRNCDDALWLPLPKRRLKLRQRAICSHEGSTGKGNQSRGLLIQSLSICSAGIPSSLTKLP